MHVCQRGQRDLIEYAAGSRPGEEHCDRGQRRCNAEEEPWRECRCVQIEAPYGQGSLQGQPRKEYRQHHRQNPARIRHANPSQCGWQADNPEREKGGVNENDDRRNVPRQTSDHRLAGILKCGVARFFSSVPALSSWPVRFLDSFQPCCYKAAVPLSANSMQRVVVTGIGVVTPIGIGRTAFWDSLVAGCSGIGPIRSFDSAPYDVHIGAEVASFDPSQYLSQDAARQLRRSSQLAVAAARLAMTDAGLPAGAASDDDIVGV